MHAESAENNHIRHPVVAYGHDMDEHEAPIWSNEGVPRLSLVPHGPLVPARKSRLSGVSDSSERSSDGAHNVGTVG